MRRMMFAAFLFCFIQTYAKAPIPEALLNAKTAAVVNEGDRLAGIAGDDTAEHPVCVPRYNVL